MPEALARLLIQLAAIYLAAGGAFALVFLARGIARIDPQAHGAPLSFRLVILPGILMLWPLLAWRWLRGVTVPPDERSPHITAARKPE